MTDQEILDKYIDLEKSCLTEKEKKEVMEMLCKYKEAFSLRDEIGTCTNIEDGNRCHRQISIFLLDNTMLRRKIRP